MTSLSPSALDVLDDCPFKYNLQYIEKIRSELVGSALLFGTAIDEALNVLLIQKKSNKSHEEFQLAAQDPKQIFDYHFSWINLKGNPQDRESAATSTYMRYYNKDFDKEILDDNDKYRLKTFIQQAGYVDEAGQVPEIFALREELAERMKAGEELKSVDLGYYNYCSWLSMRRKGHYILDHYQADILPKIKEVYNIQRKIILPDESAVDQIRGKQDFEAEFVDEPGVRYTVDNKTSSKPYKQSDINDKLQLPIYSEENGTSHGAYIVMIKHLDREVTNKCDLCAKARISRHSNCPEPKCKGKMVFEKERIVVKSQIVRDRITDQARDKHFASFEKGFDIVKLAEFPQDRTKCIDFRYPGGKCPYYNYCHSPGNKRNMEGLYKAKKTPCVEEESVL